MKQLLETTHKEKQKCGGLITPFSIETAAMAMFPLIKTHKKDVRIM